MFSQQISTSNALLLFHTKNDFATRAYEAGVGSSANGASFIGHEVRKDEVGGLPDGVPEVVRSV